MQQYITPINKDKLRQVRITEQGQEFIRRNYNVILKVINDIIYADIAENDKIKQVYDYLEDVIPGLFDNFCNIYFDGQVIDIRKTPITNIDKQISYELVDYINQKSNPHVFMYPFLSFPMILIKPFYYNVYIPLYLVSLKTLCTFITSLTYQRYTSLFQRKWT